MTAARSASVTAGAAGSAAVSVGSIVGATDEIGLRAVQDRVHVHDLHATILHLIGLDHLRLTYPHNGRDERATVNSGEVVAGVVA